MTRGTLLAYSLFAVAAATLLATLAIAQPGMAWLAIASLAGLAIGFTGFFSFFGPAKEKVGDFLARAAFAHTVRFDGFNSSIPQIIVNCKGEIIDLTAVSARMLNVQKSSLPLRFDEVFSGFHTTSEQFFDRIINGPERVAPTLLKVDTVKGDAFVQVSWLPKTLGTKTCSAILTDATELKSLETQFVQGQKMQAIGQLAGGVAHDFNNLLTAINGYCDLLLLDKGTDHPDYADLRQISNNANRAAGLVAHLLAFSRRQTLRPNILNVNNLVSQISTLLDRLVGEKVQLHFNRQPDLPRIFADGRQMEQVLMNLIVNARDAMRDGGEITITTNDVQIPQGWSQDGVSIPEGQYIVIEVADTGQGMAPDVKEKIFEPFYTTKKVGEGTGLGLSTVYGIVKQSGGYILVDSKIGQGSVFSVYVPAVNGEEAAPLTAPSTQKDLKTFGLSGSKVLLVEDETPVRKFASRALSMQGVVVGEAESGEAALQLLRQKEFAPDLVVSDVVMPGLNGPDWVREAKGFMPDLKVIFVSGYAEDIVKPDSDELRNYVFLQKPYSLSALIEAVQIQVSK
ncbi:MAG: ATP-binding protein [Pseudomonadota bacterium]